MVPATATRLAIMAMSLLSATLYPPTELEVPDGKTLIGPCDLETDYREAIPKPIN